MAGTPSSSADQDPLSQEQEKEVGAAILKAFLDRPPTIGLIGVSGTGKSSTINSMFKTDLPISHVVACTKEFRDSDVHVSVSNGQAAGSDVVLRVVDAPGLGEDVLLDPTYLAMYAENLARCDVILWVMTARNRAVALDQIYLQELSQFADRMIFGINQVDIVEPIAWDNRTNLPSIDQELNVSKILRDRKAKIEATLGRSVKLIAYSAQRKWQLQELFTSLIEAAPDDRAWMFSALKAFRHDDFLPEEIREDVMQIVKGQESTRRSKWFRR